MFPCVRALLVTVHTYVCVCGRGCVSHITMGVMNVSVQVKLSQSQRRLRGQ